MHSRPLLSLLTKFFTARFAALPCTLPAALFCAALLLLLPTPAHADGLTCLTAASGDWSDPATWSACDNAIPGPADDVYIQTGHTVTLTADAAVNNVNLSTGTTGNFAGSDAFLALGANVLDIHGSLRLYYAPLGTTPGTNSTIVHNNAITITPGSPGRLRFVGDARTILDAGQWGAPNAGSSSNYAVEIAMNEGMTATIKTQTRASSWRIHSGIVTTESSATLFADNGGPGDVTIDKDGVLMTSITGVTYPIISRSPLSTLSAGKLTVAGRLIFTGIVPYLNVSAFDLPGSVEYRGRAQFLVQPRSGSAPLDQYGDLVLAGGIITLTTDIAVNGMLTLESGGLGFNSHTLTYGPDAGLRYAGATPQAPGPELPAALPRLHVANPAGLTLPANLAVSRAITLDADLTTGSHLLTLGPDAACAGDHDVLGSVTRTTLAPATAYCFGHPDLRVTFHADATLPASVTVTTSRSAPTLADAVARQYTIAAPGFSGQATLRLPFRDDELNANQADKLQLWHSDGADWIALPPSASGAHFVEADNVTTFSTWALKNGPAPTAVTLVNLEASTAAGPAMLRWQTGSELDTVAFHIYRGTTPALPAAPIAVLPAQAPGSPHGAAYAWADALAPAPGVTYYYWVADVDWQGRETVNPPLTVRSPSLYLPWLSGGEK